MFLPLLCPGTILASAHSSELPAKLLLAPLVWVHRGNLVPPLQPLYDGHYAVLRLPGTGSTITVATDAVPVPSTGTATEVGPLTSSPPSRGQSSGGALWAPAFTPGDGQTSWVYSSNPVLHLYISCYVTLNKPVLSYLLLRLLPQYYYYACREHYDLKYS
jgi:hypothetical protein